MVTNSFSYVGKEAEDTVCKFNADIMFFSCHGLSEDGFMTDPSIDEANLRQVMLTRAKEKYLLCDSSKFRKTFFYNMGSISELDGIISESLLPESINKLLQK